MWAEASVLLLVALFSIVGTVLQSLGPRLKEGVGRKARITRAGLIFFMLILAGSTIPAIYQIWKNQEAAQKEQAAANDNLANIKRLVEAIKHEGLRVGPSDFQIHLIVFRYGLDIAESKPPPSFHTSGWIGNASFICELVAEDDPWRLPSGRGGTPAREGTRYDARNIIFNGLEHYPCLNELNTLALKLDVPWNVFSLRTERRQAGVDLTIKGRHFAADVDQDGRATIPLEMKLDEPNYTKSPS
jgi:hypothetical protein